MAALTAQEINYTQLGREIAVTEPTAKRWIALLKQSFQWRDIPAFDQNSTKRVTQNQKGYFTDTGLACYLQQISTPTALQTHPLRGALFETYIANTIEALLQSMPFEAKLYHWRSKSGAKVDLIIALDGKLYPIVIKIQSRLSKHDARGLRTFRQAYASSTTPVMPGIIIYTGRTCFRIDEHTLALPWNAITH